MALRPRVEAVAAGGALLCCAAFLTSFVLGLGRAAAPPDELVPASPPPLVVPDRAAGRVEVLNASGHSGLARAATERLRNAGFDVVYFGNAPGVATDSSRVLDRTGNTSIARAVARRLGIESVRTVIDSSLFLDATVVLGRNWRARTDSTAARPRR